MSFKPHDFFIYFFKPHIFLIKTHTHLIHDKWSIFPITIFQENEKKKQHRTMFVYAGTCAKDMAKDICNILCKLNRIQVGE